jgi:hypothetical protein
MVKKLLLLEKVILLVLIGVTLYGFFYFENSLVLKYIVTIVAAIGLFFAFRKQPEKAALASNREFIFLLVLYLGNYSLYNLKYGMSIPTHIIMLAVFVMVTGLFYGLISLDRLDTLVAKPIFHLLIILVGLIVVEIFLALSFWPIDPQAKSLIIVVIFYLFTSLIYLYIHSVLKLKRVIGYLASSLLIIGLIILGIIYGFLK